MRTPAPGELLDVWDLGAVLPPAQRLLPLLEVASGRPSAELAGLGAGERDRLLVEIRGRLFGDTMRSVVDCPTCGSALEVSLNASTLLAAGPGPAVVEATAGGYRLRCREPRTDDLVDAATAATAAAARSLLIERCVLSAERDGPTGPTPVSAGDLPDAVVAAAAAALADAHPLVDVVLPLGCQECGMHWTRPFDIAAFLWQELDVWAVRLLGEVHALAAAYGWRETEILALTPVRRRHYLDLVGHD